jgi:thiol-disulfide isomerase/thioredoxin
MWLPLLALAQLGGPFTDLDYDAALARAREDGKLVLVDFTAEWCQPCKKMEKDTWGDAAVGEWLAANALALQIDVDAQRELAGRFEIEAMPTVVALRDGQEFDRIVGYKDAQAFLQWARDVRAGKSSKEALAERARALHDSTDVRARLELAGQLLQTRQLDEALHHYLWLWPATREVPALAGVRLSFLLSQMRELSQRHAPAREAFARIQADLQTRVDAPGLPSFQDWQEWTSWCRSFGEANRIVAWYEARRDGDGKLFADQDGFLAEHVRATVFEQLMSLRRYADAAHVQGDLVGQARKQVAELAERPEPSQLPEAQRKQIERMLEERLTKDLSDLFCAALATDEPDAAGQIAALLLETLDSPASRIALTRAALQRARVAFPAIPGWLDEAEAAGAPVKSLRRKFERVASGAAADEGDD